MRGRWVGDEVMNPLVQLTEKIEQAGVLDAPAAKAKQVAGGYLGGHLAYENAVGV